MYSFDKFVKGFLDFLIVLYQKNMLWGTIELLEIEK